MAKNGAEANGKGADESQTQAPPKRRGPRRLGAESPTPVERLVLRTPTAFRRKLLAVAALAILALAAVSGFLAWHQYRANQHRAVSDLNARVVLVGGLLDALVQGGINTLEATAEAPVIQNQRTGEMSSYLRHVDQTAGKQLFTAGIGWLDAGGNLGAGSGKTVPKINLAYRDYFKQVETTRKPYVSSGLISYGFGKPTVVVAVPTFDRNGRFSGVLTGAILLNPNQKPSPSQARQNEALGFTGLTVIDRAGQLITGGLKHVAEPALLARIAKSPTGDVKGSPGLAGGSHHVVAWATSKTLDWKVAIDRPESELYASARRSLTLDLVSIGVAALVALLIFAVLARRSRREIEERGGHAQSWSRLSRSLATATTAAEIADAVLVSVQEVFTDAVAVAALESETGHEIRVTSSLPGWRRVPGDTDRLRLIAELTHDGPRTVSLERGDLRELYDAFGGRLKALHAVPILDADGEPGGGIALLTARGRLASSEWELLGAYAAQAARALDRARAFEHEHDLAVRLQRSLLPAELPEAPGIGLAGEYLAGGTGIEIGGDWYDAVLRPDGILQLCVGDVSGRGVGAATIMGRQRSVFRAYAYDYESPAEVLRRMIRHVNDDEMITAACVTLDTLEGVIVYSSAGHPPPLLLDRESGEITRLDGASSPPLGVAEPGDVVEHRIELPLHATLALYTDGLVERRGESIETGIEALARAMSETPGLSPDAALATVGSAIGASNDDVALLLAAIEPAGRIALELPADPSVLPDTRRRLRAWLQRRGFGDAEPEIVLAISEALNNAIEHAYRGSGGSIRLDLGVEGDLLRIDVADRGRWVEATPSAERGRGLMLMRTLMDDVEIDRAPDGTTVTLARRRVREPAAVPAV